MWKCFWPRRSCHAQHRGKRDRLPNAEPWRMIKDRRCLHAGLTAIYGWYEHNAALAACVLRDVEYHAVIQRIVELRFGPSVASYREVLGGMLNPKRAQCCRWR
jgi:hypothetical protein